MTERLSDYEKCDGGPCPLKATCRRFTAPAQKPSQVYLSGIPFDARRKACDHYDSVIDAARPPTTQPNTP